MQIAEATGNAYEWIERHYNVKLNNFQKKVCEILQMTFKGIYNGPHVDKYNWTCRNVVSINCMYSLSTFDCDKLTKLVIFAHQYGVRVEIKPCNMQYIRIYFSDRPKRDGEFWERHPDIIQAISQHNPEVLEEYYGQKQQ